MDHLERQYRPTPGWDERKAGRANRQQMLVMLVIAAALAAMSSQLWWDRAFPPDTFDPPRFNNLIPATDVQSAELERIAREYREVYIDARLTGDTSAFAAHLYNDPDLEVWETCDAMIDDHAREIDLRLRAGPASPIGAERGLLSCEVGGVIEQWEYAQARATADATLPSPDGGYTPATFMRRQVGPRVRQTTYFHKPMVSSTGRYATINESYYPDPNVPMARHYAFTNVNGRWYISSIWSDCRKDTPCA